MVWQYLGLAGDGTDVFMRSFEWEALNKAGAFSPMQQVGLAARSAGYDGVLYPAILSSYVMQNIPDLYNVAVFMDPANTSSPAAARTTLTLHDPTGTLP